MFYSHEILTSRKYGVATVWLVATLGAKSNTKKVNKKAILDVNVKKACDTIMRPEAPMALRLQSNLLYGVSRVYDQQCGYVLSDAQAAQLKIRDLLRIIKNNDLDTAASKARPDQLILLDDPAFLPDMALPALDFDFSNLEVEPYGVSQRSSQSMMSIRKRSGSVVSSRNGSLIQLDFQSSSTHAGAYQLPVNDQFGGSSAQKGFGGTGRDPFDDEERHLYDDDMIFEFDDNGEMVDINVSERAARSLFPSGQGRLESDSAASGRVRKEHEDALVSRVLPVFDGEGNFDVNFGDDAQMLPDAEPFSMPMLAGGLFDSDKLNPAVVREEHRVVSEPPSSVAAEALAKRHKAKQKRPIPMDNFTELLNVNLIAWLNDYLANMATASAAHTQKKGAAHAKKNAEAWVIGNGLNGAGQGMGSSRLELPLAMFSGAALMAKITGKPIPEEAKKGTKRDSPIDMEDETVSASKRARQDDVFAFEDEVGRGNFDDEIIMHDSSSGIEIGREAPSALADQPSSAIMPWNISASLHSHQRGASSSIRAGSILAGRALSASPLIGRGSNIPGDLEHFSAQMQDEMVMYGRSDNESEIARSQHRSQSRGASSNQAEFEVFGPAAQVDTQTAASSQWVRDVLDRESGNFFEYVRNTISEKTGDELDAEEGGEETFVTFEELFDPEQNSSTVATQAFYHVLSLATKRMVWVAQSVENLVPFGEIRIGILS